MRTDQGTFELNAIGSSEFVHFDWEVSTENAEILFRGMFREGIGVYMVPTQQYDRIKQQIGDKYPNSIVNRLPTTVAPPKLVAQSGRAYVRCEAIVYIRDGYYPDEGRVENSFVKYAVNLGNGFLESEVDVLIRGPYRTDPVYWNVVNGTRPPSDEEERKAIVREFEDMKEFQKVAIELLGKTEETHAK